MSIKLNVEDRIFSERSPNLQITPTENCTMSVFCFPLFCLGFVFVFLKSQHVAVDLHGLSILLYIVFAIVSTL